MKILFISNIIGKGVGAFAKASIEAAHELGMEYHMAANFNNSTSEQMKKDENQFGIKLHHIDFERNPLNSKNRTAFKQLDELIKKEHFDIIHCNTPIGGIAGRIIGRKNGVRRVIYQAHGFHFYKGAPAKNWLLYYPAEKALARITDAIITINREDFCFAEKHLHPLFKTFYVPGVGIELEQWESHKDIREELGFKNKDFVIIVVGRLEKNKNCGVIINAVEHLHDKDIKLVFCGDGEDYQLLNRMAKGISNQVFFLGNRTDMSDLYHLADCFVMASYREGLSRSIMEAMACGLPCIVSDIRGNRDLIDLEGGVLFNPDDMIGLAERIKELKESCELREKMSAHNLEKIRNFSFEKVVEDLTRIYNEVLELETS